MHYNNKNNPKPRAFIQSTLNVLRTSLNRRNNFAFQTLHVQNQLFDFHLTEVFYFQLTALLSVEHRSSKSTLKSE